MKASGFFTSLRTKIIGGTTVVLVVMMSIFSLLLLYFERKQKLQEFQIHTTQLSEQIKVSLEYSMLTHDMKIVQEMVNTLSQHKGVEKVFIINKKGQIKISSNPADIGKVMDLNNRTCQLCHQYAPQGRNKTVIFISAGRRKHFRNVNPITNKPKCYSCHNPLEKINGVLITDFSMAGFDHYVTASVRTMGLFVLATALGMILVIAALMNKLVIKRLKRFLGSVKSISEGNLQQRVSVESNDEIGQLESSFNTMATNLRNSLREISDYKDYLENLLNSIEDGIFVVDRDYRIIMVNNALLSRLNKPKEKVIGRYCYQVYHNESKPCAGAGSECPVRETFRSGKSAQTIHIHRNGRGTERYLELHSSPVRDQKGRVYQVVEVSRNISERKKLEKQFVQAERLISMGKLAASVAHEINNPITGILTLYNVLLKKLQKRSLSTADLEDFRKYMPLMEEETSRCGQIVKNLLAFSRQSEPKVEALNINAIIEKSLSLVEHKIALENIEIIKRLDAKESTILGDGHQLQQVFLNIILNAAQAMPNGGTLTAKSHARPENKAVEIRITDTGCGIPEENLGKLFDPFFTTKENDKGLGLGLSVAYGIISQHQGTIKVESQVGKGTTFIIKLPTATVAENASVQNTPPI